MLTVTRIFVLAGTVGICAALTPALSARDGGKGQAPSQTQTAADKGKATPQPAPSSPGRGPGPDLRVAWWKDPAMAKEVGVSPAQIARFDKIVDQRQKAIQSKVDEYERLRAELNRMMADRTAKPAQVEELARRLSYPHVEIDVSRSRMLYEILVAMTPEQITKMNAMFERGRQGRGGRGSGGNSAGNPPRR